MPVWRSARWLLIALALCCVAGVGITITISHVSTDCAAESTAGDTYLCFQSSPMAVFFASDTVYTQSAGGSGATPSLQAVTTVGNSTTTALITKDAVDPDLRCEQGLVGGARLRCYDAAGVRLPFNNTIEAGKSEITSIDNGSGTQITCRTMDDTGLTTYSAQESCGRLAAVQHVEFAEDDGTHTCAAGNYGLWADLSETKLKACENGTVTDLAGDITGITSGAGIGGGCTSGTCTLTFAPGSIVNNVTLWDGTNSSRTLTYNLSGTDVVHTFSSGLDALTGNMTISGTLNSVGAITQNSVAVLTEHYTYWPFACNETAATPEYLLASAGNSGNCATDADTNTARYRAFETSRVRGIVCKAGTAPASTVVWTQTVRINGVNSACNCAMTGTTSTCATTNCTDPLAANDGFTVEHTDSSATDTNPTLNCTVKTSTP